MTFSVRFRVKLGNRATPYSNISPFSAGIQLFGLKTTSQGIPDLKDSFVRSDQRWGDILGEVLGEVRVQDHPVF